MAAPDVNLSKKTVLITGASSGIGKATAKLFFDQGWNVVTTLRKPELEQDFQKELYQNSPRFLMLELDVTKPETIEYAFHKAIEHFGKINVVINNAGYGLTGVFEALTREQIQLQFQTNVFGLMDVCRQAMQHFRTSQMDHSERILINVSSIAGRLCFPLYSVYHASKWAVEGFTESLQFECAGMRSSNLNPIKVKLIEPGVVKTDFYARSSVRPKNEQVPEEYRVYAHHALQVMDSKTKHGTTPEVVAKTIYRAATDGKSQLRYSAGMDAVFLIFFRRFLPDWLYRNMVNLVDFLE